MSWLRKKSLKIIIIILKEHAGNLVGISPSASINYIIYIKKKECDAT